MKVSVIVPIYNAEKYIERCVNSLLAQSYPELELVFVNDHSSDDSMTLLRRLLENASCDAKIIENEKNLGCSASRKIGMMAASGDYIINIDSDDYVDSRFVELLADKAIHNNSDVVVCDMVYDYGDKQVIRHIQPVDNHLELLARMLSGVVHSCWWNKLIRKSLVSEYDLYPIPQVTLGEDKVVTTRIIYYATQVDFVPQPLYYYNRANDSSMLAQSKARAVTQWITVTRCINDFFKDKTLDSRCAKALQHHKALVLGHVAIYGSDDDLIEYHNDLDVTIRDILSHPMAPIHYKVAAAAHLMGMHFVISFIRCLAHMAQRR